MGREGRAAKQPLTSADPSAPRSWLLLCLCLLLVTGVYLPAMGGPFLWDDRLLVADDSTPPSVDVLRAFTQPFWLGSAESRPSVSYFRPITTLSFGLDRVVHGDNSAGYHATNVAAHVLATGLLFGLLRRRGLSSVATLLLSLAWALLPRLTEGAAWISGRGDVLAGAFALGALWVYRPASRARLMLAGVLALAASWCKEAGLAAFAALFVLELRRPRLATERDHSVRWVLLAAPLAFYFVSRVLAGAASLGDGEALGLRLRSAAVLEAVGRYAWMLVNPFQPRSVIGQLGAPSWPFVILGGALLLGALGFVVRRPRMAPETLGYLALGIAPLLMVIHLTPLPIGVVAADRYLYLPSAGLLLAAGSAAHQAFGSQRWLGAALALLVVALGVRTIQRVADYADDARFWATAMVQLPADMTAAVELGGIAYRAGCFPEALALYSRAARLDSAAVSAQLGTVALAANALGKRDLATQAVEELMRANPRRAEVRLRRATIAVYSLDWEGARRHAQRALDLRPDFEAARSFLASLPPLVRLDDAVKAGAPASVRLMLEMRTLRYPEAVGTLRALIDDPRADPTTLRRGIEFVINRGDPRDASELLPRYLRVRPDPDAPRLTAAVQVRVEAAENLRAQLRERGISLH